ncbi:MAG: serine/threonine-protein kinase [Planctomycetota bacterium]|nr:serine/threonine-protein kinase [Planctomycetota bacterium]
MSAQNEDFLFAQEAQNLGYVTEAQVEEGFLLQERMADDLQIDERLAVILVKRGWLADEQARRVYGIIEPEGARSQIEGYRLLQKVGRGAMGTVYQAMHKGLNRVVAIKILRRDLAADKTQIERLKREAKLLADLEHPNVVRAFDAGESNGFPYLVMEYVEGDTLREKIARDGPLDESEALRITRGLADALEKARRMGVVHRDVKPGNILIDKKGEPKLMDLGLAKGPIDAGLTQHGATVGTPQFMSPEQAESPDKADTRSDIYSLGATLYAMVTGRPPFEGTTLAEIITKVMSQQPVPPGMVNRDVSPEVSHLIERMMLKDASLRYATPSLVMDDIDRIRGGQSIIPGGFQGNWEAYLLRKRFLEWRKRIVVGVAAALILGVGVFMYLEHTKKEAASRDLGSRLERLLTIRDVGPEDDQASLQARLALLRAGHAELQTLSDETHVPYPGEGRDAIGNRIARLNAAVKLFEALAKLDADLTPLRDQGRWRQALAEAEKSTTEYKRFVPSQRQWQELVDGLKADSRTKLESEEDRIAAMAVASIDDFLAKQAARAALYGRPWIEERGFGRTREAARTAHAKARTIGTKLGAFNLAFAPAAVQARVDALDLYGLRGDFTQAAATLRKVTEADADSWPTVPEGARERVKAQLFGERGLVQAAIQAVDADIDMRVRAAWAALKASLGTISARDALEALGRFANEAERGNHYIYLAREARAEESSLRVAVAGRMDAEREAFDRLRRKILAELREANAVRLREVADDALADELLDQARRADVLALREAASALEALYAGALAGLQVLRAAAPNPVLREVVYRDRAGNRQRAKQWILRDLDAEKGVLRVRIPRGDKRGTVEFQIGQVSIPNLRAWMAQSDERLTPLHDAILAAAALTAPEDRPGLDLRPLVQSYRALQDRFGPVSPGPQWRRLIGELVLRLEAAQRSREDEAQRAVSYIRTELFGDKSWKGLVELAGKLLDPKGRLRYTRAVENVADDLRDKRRWAWEALDKDELRRMLAGDVKPKELPGGATELLFDFDDRKQLENFPRGFGRWERAGAVVTPGEEGGGQLYLLPGVRGLVRDRPLVLRSMFDPAAPLSMEVRINILRGSSLIAFDLDGVQVAICSFDPNLWKRRFREGAPRLDGQDTLPEFDFHGMGRGVAFHMGPSFGPSFPYGNWDWAVTGQGRNFAKLKERSYLQAAGGRLFAFEPGAASAKVRVERDRNFVRLFVDDKLVIERENHEFTTRGLTSEVARKKIRHGSGLLQLLTWSPLIIDDLTVRGTIREGWKRARREALAAEAAKAKAAEKAAAKDAK